MITSLFLAQLLGLFLTIVGVSILLKHKELRHIVDVIHKNKLFAHLAGRITLIIGLLLVLNHNIWDGGWIIIITILSWIILIKGVAFLILPNKELKRMGKAFSVQRWYVSGAVLWIILGLYLAGKGFQII